MLALLDVIDRDGHVRQSLPVREWPVRVGRSLDNDLVLDDRHTAANHFTLDRDAAGVFIEVGQTANGLRADGRRLAAGTKAPIGDRPLRIDLGDSHLRLRLAEHPLPDEVPLKTPAGLWHTGLPILVAALLAVGGVLFGTWLDTDPDDFTRALGSLVTGALGAALLWCGAWSLLSKVFTRRSHFWWHVRVMLFAVVANQVVGTLAMVLAFALSWPWVSDYAFVAVYAIGAAMLYFHVLGIEPRQPQRMRAVAVGIYAAAVALHLWFNVQSRDQLGDELYMSHLFPPGLRLARPVDSASFVQGLEPLKATLDKKAKKRGSGDDSAGPDDEE